MQADKEKWDRKHSDNPSPGLPSLWVVTHLPLVGGGHALDLACGVGRHALLLAEQGFTVDAWDISPVAFQRLHHPQIHCREIDLDHVLLPTNTYDLIIITCYLNRNLFPSLPLALKPGGWLLFETFVADGTPQMNPAYMLAPEELRHSFPNLITMAYVEDKGMAALAARRPELGAS